jgi:outer membrane murein-binding lipoprotein Lpp
MKKMRAFLMIFLVVTGVCLFSGCATTSRDSYTATTDMRGIQQQEPSPTEDMEDANAFEKVCYYLLTFAATIPYGLAGGH